MLGCSPEYLDLVSPSIYKRRAMLRPDVRRPAMARGSSFGAALRSLVLVLATLLMLSLVGGCKGNNSADLLNVIDVAPHDVEVGDTVEVLGTNLPSNDVGNVSVVFEGKLHRPGEDPVAVEGLEVTGAKASPDMVTFTFTEALQAKFCGVEAVHTTFRGDILVRFDPTADGGQAVHGRVVNIVMDFRPPSPRRVVMQARTDEGKKALAFMGIETNVEGSPASGGMLISNVRAQSPADQTGLVANDVLLAFNGVAISSLADIAPSNSGLTDITIKRGDAPPQVRQISMAGYKPSAIPADILGALLILGIAAFILLIFMAPTAGIITWVERRVSARFQSRVGPNRAGPQGFLVWIADGIKSIHKEDIIPTESDEALFRLAPYLVFIGVSATFVVMPFGQYLIAADLDIGILFVIAVTSLVAIGLMTGGWASNNKWSLLGGIRAAAQVISYEIPAAVAIVCVVMMSGSLRMQDIIIAQGGAGDMFLTQGGWPWYWYVFKNPITFALFFLFFTTALAEGNRAPFDLPEAESELVAGYSTEYSGMRYLFFFFAEWANVFVFCGIASALFLGGWQVPGVTPSDQEASLGLQLFGTFLFLLKSWILIFVVVWIRWTLPRVRIDQLMNLCWKWFVPMAFAAFISIALLMLVQLPAVANLVISLITFGAAVFLVARFASRVRFNVKASKRPVHLNPFI